MGDIEYERLVSQENIWRAWETFARGKWRQPAVRTFWLEAEREVFSLYHDLHAGTYAHGAYHHFTVNDTKRRDVYVATVRDKVVHQTVAQYLEQQWGAHFYHHSYAAQREKGVAAARQYALQTIRRLSARRQIWIGKLDVEKYFSNINQEILLRLLYRRISDARVIALCRKIIESFGENGCGLPLGNVTSQWFANVYLHELDWHAKHVLKIHYYLRYNDDIIIMSTNRQQIMEWSVAVQSFARDALRLTIPSHKVTFVGLPKPIDILGLVTNGQRVWIRRKTLQRARAQVAGKCSNLAQELLDTVSSYYGCGINQIFSVENLVP